MNNEGVWLRGNLHMHTSRSDGALGYEDAVSLYERHGYDFVAVTDHWVISKADRTPGGMILLSGCEYNVGKTVREGIYHIVAIGMERDPGLVRDMQGLQVQDVIDAVRAAGGMAILAHPAWSLNSADRVADLHGLIGTEIYNATSGFPRNVRPYSGMFVDQLASMGMRLPCIAADDAHEYDTDALRGWIMLHVKEKTEESILDAIRKGDYYATEGPELRIDREGDRLYVTCSPAEHIVFYSDDTWNPERVFSGHGITQAQYNIWHQDTFVRVEVIDAQGKRAYSSPIAAR